MNNFHFAGRLFVCFIYKNHSENCKKHRYQYNIPILNPKAFFFFCFFVTFCSRTAGNAAFTATFTNVLNILKVTVLAPTTWSGQSITISINTGKTIYLGSFTFFTRTLAFLAFNLLWLCIVVSLRAFAPI